MEQKLELLDICDHTLGIILRKAALREPKNVSALLLICKRARDVLLSLATGATVTLERPELIRKCQSLERMTLSGCQHLPWDVVPHGGGYVCVPHALAHLTRLTRLDVKPVDGVETMPEDEMRKLGCLVHLRHLCLSGCKGVSGAGLEHIAKLPLATLDLSNCMSVTSQGLEHLRTHTTLKHLDLASCGIAAEPPTLSTLAALTFLSLKACPLASNDSFSHISSLTALEHLDLDSCAHVTNAALAPLTTLTGLKTLILDLCTQFSDNGLKHLSVLKSLQVLSLHSCIHITDAGLAHLTPLRNLQKLILAFCDNISDAGLSHLRTLSRLKSLDLTFCGRISDAGLSHLTTLKKLESMHITACELISDRGLEHLSVHTTLKSLIFGPSSRILDSGIQQLTSLTSLTRLVIGVCPEVSDASILRLSTLVDLRELTLSGCTFVSDRSFDCVAALPSLEVLTLSGCQISDDGLAKLVVSPLREITLSFCESVTEAGLAHFLRSSRVGCVHIRGCRQVSRTALDSLAGAHSVQIMYR